MTDPRLRRFLHLEGARPRRPDPAAEGPGAAAERIAGVEQPAAPSPARTIAPPAPGADARRSRFGPEPEPVLDLADPVRPFIRCARCDLDSNAFAVTCPGCGADLTSPAQQAHDQRFWAERDAQAAQEAQAAADLAAGRARAEAEEAAARRALGEVLAREVGEAERRRLDGALGGGGGWSNGGGATDWDPTPLGLRLLRWLPSPWGGLAVTALAVLVGALVLHGALSTRRGAALPIGLALLLVLFAPLGGRRRRWW